MTHQPRGGAVSHGKSSTYTNHHCRCTPCRKAHAEDNTTLRRERYSWRVRIDGRLVATRANVHSSASTYQNWGCRCRPCTDAQAAMARRRRA